LKACLGPKDKSLCIPLSDYDHLYRKLLRVGELKVDQSVKILKDYLKQLNGSPIDYGMIVPISGLDHAYASETEVIMPHRSDIKTIYGISVKRAC
jgi:hypothetical protein